jgi:hypothetical protein
LYKCNKIASIVVYDEAHRAFAPCALGYELVIVATMVFVVGIKDYPLTSL